MHVNIMHNNAREHTGIFKLVVLIAFLKREHAQIKEGYLKLSASYASSLLLGSPLENHLDSLDGPKSELRRHSYDVQSV